ncbi:hypothetical protein KEH51_25230 [[Brevibacterium] frigoritolerans]|uniref:Uncharacterized protein n=1 Tax=Peribacillus frigoritolerans TaxID=450367 RepID=A0A941J8U0_9BACI|nr:hypothetical protein [Peribacillus frigoritolerans]
MACFGQQADVKYCRCRRLLHEYKEDIQLDRQGPEMVALIYSLSIKNQKGLGMKSFLNL